MIHQTGCVIAGCGPAGAMLGLLLARAGVRVTVFEKHGDFLRDFRGDTIHPSTMWLLDELGLGAEFGRLPHQGVRVVKLAAGSGEWPVADFGRLPGRHRELTFMPQWDFLDFVTRHAAAYPTFELHMNTEVTGLRIRDGRVVGLTHERGEVEAALTVAADGRRSTVRQDALLPSRKFGSQMDVLWFCLSRRKTDSGSTAGRVAPGRLLLRLDRGDYWQLGYVIRKGGYQELRRKGLDAFRDDLAELEPMLADRVGEIRSWDDVSALDVQIDRLQRWYRPGFLCIGDAAHAMSPVGGVGINLAVQDAVAAANMLARPLLANRLTERDLARVQRRRVPPTVVTQAIQRTVQNRLVAPLLAGKRTEIERPLRRLRRWTPLQVLTAYVIGIGVRPEHVRAVAPR